MTNHHGISPRILETLRALGLTEYAARCYVALVSLGTAEASAVADASEVPRTKVYAALKDLVDAGWATAEGGRPVVYRAVAPQERIAQAEKGFVEAADAAARELQARFASGAEMVPVSLYLLRGEDAVRRKSEELIGRARERVLVNLGFDLPGDARALAPALERAQRRGVQVRLALAPGLADAEALGPWLRDARVATFPFRAVLVDDHQGLISLPSPEGAIIGLWNPTAAFMGLMGPLLRQSVERAPPWQGTTSRF